MPSGTNSIQIIPVKLGLIRPTKRPLRIHSRNQRRNIARLFRLAGGQPIPLIVTPDFEIIDGHALYDHLIESGVDEALVTILHTPDQSDVRALRLLINRIVEDTKWDKPNLKLEFLELGDIGFDLELTGFRPAEIDDILKLDIPANTFGEDLDHLSPLEESVVAALGDIFQLGDNRIACGDPRDRELVKCVCNGARADIG